MFGLRRRRSSAVVLPCRSCGRDIHFSELDALCVQGSANFRAGRVVCSHACLRTAPMPCSYFGRDFPDALETPAPAPERVRPGPPRSRHAPHCGRAEMRRRRSRLAALGAD